ncbi:MAG: DEAD/DEAH box helicase family protein [Methanobrevibacter sp.]|nr:DEAD/DEAH box helicase family protein [Methanobrevibacter sp.]
MSFKDLTLRSTYNSARNDPVEDFYVPVLKEAKTYDRVVGYFNSYSLALVADGLKDFIMHNGKMRLLCGTELNSEDEHAILNASEIAKVLSDNFLQELDFIADDIQMNRIKLLAWMVDNDYLDIKVGIVKDALGYVGGILHEKTGILADNDDNMIIFSGSNNETKAAMSTRGKGNIEKFKVFLSWEDSKFMEDDIGEFYDYWNNLDPYLEVMDIPSAAKNGLIKYAPNTIEEVIGLDIGDKLSKSTDERKLRGYQKEAISKWIENNYNGIFEMATGTGKTFTALNCIKKVLEDNSKLLTVIACPYAHLSEQWADDVGKNFDINVYNIYSSSNPNWKKDLKNLALDMSLGIIDKAIILTTHKTFSSDLFIREISNINVPSFLIVDEMHHVVSKAYSKGLCDFYDFRLGLSATPKVNNNEEGTNFVFGYFDGIVFEFDLTKALTNFGENGKTFLAQYDYYPKKVSLNSWELSEYYRLSDKIKQLYHMNKNEESNAYKALKFQRSNIIKNAESKYDCLRDILRSYDNLDHLIVFCSPQQIDNVLKILEQEGISPVHRFTNKEGTKKSAQFGGISHRQYLVNKFDEGYFKSLVAIKCLDEGVDIPSAEKVIIMSSSTNPGEYIQRRGRVLRRSEGKDKAEIYDMVVLEYDSLGNPIEDIVRYEKIRLEDFINSSDNPGECMELLKEWGISL